MSHLKNLNTPPPSELLDLVAEQKKTIEQLKTDNDILRNIIAMIPGNVYWKDNEGRYLGCNNNVASIFGFNSPQDIIGKRNRDLFDTRLAFLADQIDKIVNRTATERYIEEIGLSVNKEPAIYLSKKLPLYDNMGNIVGILGVSFDITERKKMEEDLKIAKQKAEASSRAKSQFLAVVNHELRTPLASIIGLIDFIKQGRLSETDEKNLVEAIENCTHHLLALVNEILEFSRLESGKYKIRIETIDLIALLHEVYDITKTLAKKKNLKLDVQADPDIPHRIVTDVRVLRQILINLVSNAIKFTEEGQITLKLTKLEQRENLIRLKISVIDTGIGIPAEKLDLIFEPFQQLENAYTRQSSRSGTGLGLAIVEKLSKMIGAKTHVQSEVGKGSTFSVSGEFEIPKENNTSPSTSTLLTERSEKKKHKKISLKGKRIYPELVVKQPKVLLIEDDPIVQFVHKKMLMDLGCKVDAYEHGYAAIQGLTNHDIVLVDISLPDISGFEVIKIIREQKKEPLPIIALTVYTGKEEKQASVAAGANAFSSKPISQNRLRKLLIRYLPQKN